jgi:large subunit ribosomal protein L20
MPRVKRGFKARARRKKVVKLAKGFHRDSRTKYRRTAEKVKKALVNKYISRRLLKRDMRSLWVKRITAAAKLLGTSYSRLIKNLKDSGCKLNRKMLAEIAANDMAAFESLQKAVSQNKK